MADHLILTNADRTFYPTLGPFLARRDVTAAVGGPIWDDDGKVWVVLRVGRQMLGFVAVAERGGRTVVESLYVADPSWHRVAAELVAYAADRYADRTLHAVVSPDREAAYTAAGFVRTGQRGRFVTLTREANP